MKILFVVCSPLFPTNSGIKQSALGRVYDAVQAGHDVEVIEVDNELKNLEPVRPSDFKNVRVHRIANESARTFRGELAALLSMKPRYVSLFGNERICHRMNQLFGEIGPDKVVAESIWATVAIPQRYLQMTELVVHDVLSEFFYEMARTTASPVRRLLFAIDWVKIKGYERQLVVRDFSSYTFLTAHDRDWYIERFKLKHENAAVATNRLFVNPVTRCTNLDEPFILFPGSIEFSQNFFALQWYLDQVVPHLGEGFDIPIFVTGRYSDKNRSAFARYPHLRFTSEITLTQLEHLYASCLCVVSPIVSGTGIKIKVLEAAQRGIPVVATFTSAKGIESEHCYRCEDDDPRSFAHALSGCIRRQLSPVSE